MQTVGIFHVNYSENGTPGILPPPGVHFLYTVEGCINRVVRVFKRTSGILPLQGYNFYTEGYILHGVRGIQETPGILPPPRGTVSIHMGTFHTGVN